MKIIVTGSLGHIGRPLTILLVKNQHSVTVISSNPERQKEIEALGATAAIGLVEDVDFLTSAFIGADVVYAMIPPKRTVPDPKAYSQKIADSYAQALQRSEVKRLLYVSSYGAQLEKGAGLISLHHHVETTFNKVPNLVALTHLRATYVYYNFYGFVDMIKKEGVISANYGGDDKLVMVSPEDIAAAVAEEIAAQTTGKKIRYVASDQRTCNEVAHILGKAIGKPDLKWVTITDRQMQSRYEASGIPAPIAAAFVEMFGAIHSNLLHEDYELNTPKTMGKIKIEDFAKEFAAAFK